MALVHTRDRPTNRIGRATGVKEPSLPIQPTAETIRELQDIAEELLASTDADRTTVRIDTPNDRDYPILAEARKVGVPSLTGGMSLKGYKPVDIHKTSTVTFLRERREMIIQRDARVDPPVLPELIEYYGVTGQMLMPLENEGAFVGLVSVHSIAARDWTDEDIARITVATAKVDALFRRANWISLDESSSDK